MQERNHKSSQQQLMRHRCKHIHTHAPTLIQKQIAFPNTKLENH